MPIFEYICKAGASVRSSGVREAESGVSPMPQQSSSPAAFSVRRECEKQFVHSILGRRLRRVWWDPRGPGSCS